MSESETLPGPLDTADTRPRARRQKACNSCHALKVRCLPVDLADPQSPCVRCVNLKKVCEINWLEPRKRRKKSKKEEQELIEKLNKEVALLKQKLLEFQDGLPQKQTLPAIASPCLPNHPDAFPNDSSPLFITNTDLESELAILGNLDMCLKDISDDLKTYADIRAERLRPKMPLDAVGLGLISAESAKDRLEKYHQYLYATHPFVHISPELSVDEFRQTLPFLFNTVMSITSVIVTNQTLEETLALEDRVTQDMTMEIMVRGHKSLELIKCLVLMSVWYNTPEFFKLRRFHILTSLAVTLLYDAGLVSKATATGEDDKSESNGSAPPTDIPRDMESRALIITLYLSAVSFCIILRRTIYVTWTPYVEECCTLLEQSPQRDHQRLALFLRLNHEIERISHYVHTPYDSGKPRPRLTKYAMAEFITRLEVYKNKISSNDHQLMAYYYSVEAYLQQPQFEDLQIRKVGGKTYDEFSAQTFRSIAHCTESCLRALDEFNLLAQNDVASLLLILFSRVVYTAGILMRLRYFILSLPSHVEKELVPRRAVYAIQALNRSICSASRAHKNNFFLKKMMLVLQLFILTYMTQVSDMLTRNHGTSRVLFIAKRDMKEMGKLAFSMSQTPKNPLSAAPDESNCIHLDLLSYAATRFSKSVDSKPTNPEGGKFVPKGGTLDANLQIPPMINTPISMGQPSVMSLGPSVPVYPNDGDDGPIARSSLRKSLTINGMLGPLEDVVTQNPDSSGSYLQSPHPFVAAKSPLPRFTNGAPMWLPNVNNGQSVRNSPGANFQPSPGISNSTSAISGSTPGLPNSGLGFDENWNGRHNLEFPIEDEFWSNLLGTDADSYYFAQETPIQSTSVL